VLAVWPSREPPSNSQQASLQQHDVACLIERVTVRVRASAVGEAIQVSKSSPSLSCHLQGLEVR
jgi:hypothetical protein